MIACAASPPPSGDSAATACVDAGEQLVHRQPLADQAGRADRDVGRAEQPSSSATCSAVAWVSGKPAGPVQALAPPELSTTASTRPSVTTCAAPDDRRGLDPVAGEDGGGGVRRPVVDDERDVGLAGGLEAGGDPGGPEARGGGDAHGATPAMLRPAVSARPSAMLALCTAWPAAPLLRLSIALTTMTRPESTSTVRLQVAGVAARASRRSAASAPRAARGRTARRRTRRPARPVRPPASTSPDRLGGDRGEDAPRHRRQHRRERQRRSRRWPA